jgi:hypothetical protein
MKLHRLLFCVLLAAFAASGCIFSPDESEDTPPPPPATCTTATSPDQCMEVFREVYANMNLDCYSKLLSQEYLFIPQEGASYGFDVEIEIARKMFDGVAGENNFVIQSIAIDQLEPQGVWRATPANDPNFGGYPESQYRNYLVDIKFSIQGQNLILRVQGPVLYYVLDEGADGQDFKILGMVDATYGN